MTVSRAMLWCTAIASMALLAIIVWLSMHATTQTESGLAGVFLSLVSLVASWIMAHYYYLAARKNEINEITRSHNESLRTYALKAAEKVTNLSSELARLSTYLKEYAQNDHEEDDVDVILSVRDERISSVIHIVDMLRSVNDTSLSDWRGVIGEELEKQREADEEKEVQKEERILAMMHRVEALLDGTSRPAEEELQNTVASELHQIKETLSSVLANYVSPATLTQRVTGQVGQASKKNRVFANCPQCGSEVRLATNKHGAVTKRTYLCTQCNTRLVYNRDEDQNPVLDFRAEKQERFRCPSCGEMHVALLDNATGAFVLRECNRCGERFRAYRNSSEVVIAALGKLKSKELDPELLEAVKMLMPPQPWPKGAATYVAEKLGKRRGEVDASVQYLISIGVFQRQVNGKLYATAEEAAVAQIEAEQLPSDKDSNSGTDAAKSGQK